MRNRKVINRIRLVPNVNVLRICGLIITQSTAKGETHLLLNTQMGGNFLLNVLVGELITFRLASFGPRCNSCEFRVVSNSWFLMERERIVWQTKFLNLPLVFCALGVFGNVGRIVGSTESHMHPMSGVRVDE
jgi:hypothetical protein